MTWPPQFATAPIATIRPTPMNDHGNRHPRARLALLAGVGIVVLYLAGAAVSGRASILARRPLLDGLAPPTPYRWVSPPPDLAASNKPPASTRFTVELTANGSRLGASRPATARSTWC